MSTTPTLAEKLKAIYPALKPGVEYTLTHDGASLATWTPRQSALKQPTPAVIASAYDVIVKSQAQARTISAAGFIQRIPPSTWAKVTAARQGTTPLAVALDQGIAQLCATPVVVADDPQLIGMLAQLVAVGVLTEAERAQILGF